MGKYSIDFIRELQNKRDYTAIRVVKIQNTDNSKC